MDYFNNLFEHDDVDTTELISNTLDPWLDKSFVIRPDGTSQTNLNNKGRFGFWVERQFGIDPNKDQNPDAPWGELKSLCCDQYKPCSIGQISRPHWSSIEIGAQDNWSKSFAHNKMSSTLFVAYSKSLKWTDGWGYVPEYTLINYRLIELTPELIKEQLEADWDAIVYKIKRSSRYGDPKARYSGDNLVLTYKGKKKDGVEYYYPSLSFTAKFVARVFD
jgi:hypothetical protein